MPSRRSLFSFRSALFPSRRSVASNPPSSDLIADAQRTDAPVTFWIRQLEAGESAAAGRLWEHFCSKLIRLAGGKLTPQLRRTYDEEDVAVSAFHSLCRAVSNRRATDLDDRDNLWRLLVTIAERKIAKRCRDESREKRDRRRTVGEVCLLNVDGDGSGFDQLAGREPTPEFAAQFLDLCQTLLDSLPDETLRDIARLKLRDCDSDEIAAKLGLSRRTVQRKLLIVKARCRALLPDEGEPPFQADGEI